MIPTIAPSILAADFAALGDAIHVVEGAGAEWIHVDVMDGHFVPNISIGVPVVESIRPVTALPLDVHLMIAEPERYVEPFAKAGADHLLVHLEVAPDPTALLQQIKALGCKAGLCLNPDTPVESLRPYIPLADIVLVMTVFPGFGGQSFIEGSLPRIRQIRAMVDDLHPGTPITVDGGIDEENGARCVAEGATVLVAGSSIYRAEVGAAEAVRRLRAAGTAAQAPDNTL